MIVCGEVRDGVIEFFEELFHVDHGTESRHAIVIAKGTPSSDMLSLLRSPRFTQQLTYLDGNVMDENDLERGEQ